MIHKHDLKCEFELQKTGGGEMKRRRKNCFGEKNVQIHTKKKEI